MPQAATLNRSLVVQGFIRRTFATIYTRLSQLRGRTIEQYCKDEETVPKYIIGFCNQNEKEIIASTTPVEEYDVRLIHKLLKTCCGLMPPKPENWGSEAAKDTFEYLITFCWTEHVYLEEASEKTDDDLNSHMDRVLHALIQLVEKVEKQKKVKETRLKKELNKCIEEPLEKYDDCPCSHYRYTILRDHLVHQILVMVYRHLNQLHGMSLNDYLNQKRLQLVPRTLLSNERKFLEGNPPPEKMSVSILYRVVKRVCFDVGVRMRDCPDGVKSPKRNCPDGFKSPKRDCPDDLGSQKMDCPDKHESQKKDYPDDLGAQKKNYPGDFGAQKKGCPDDLGSHKWDCPDTLQSILYDLNEEYRSSPRNEEEYADKCYKVHNLLKNALAEVCNKMGKPREFIIENLAKEMFVVESFQKPSEPPMSTTQNAVSLPKNPLPPEESPISSTSPETSTSPSQAKKRSTLTVEQVNVAILYKVMCPGGLIPQTLSLVFVALKGDLETLKKGKIFTSKEKGVIENCKDRSKYREELSKTDISFMCKLLRHGCPSLSTNNDEWLTNTDPLKYHITLLKNERNKLAHEVSSIKPEQLKKTLESTENSLLTILEETENKLEDSEHDMKTILQAQRVDVKDEMLKTSQISQAFPFNLAEVEDMISDVKTAAQEELQQPYVYRESLHCMSPISGSSDPRHNALTFDTVFMERELEDKDEITAESTYRIEDLLFSKDKALASFRTFIIHSRPGDGKTCICKYAFHCWAANVTESSQKGVDLLIYIPCRFVNTNSLSAYLKGKLSQTFKNINSDDIIPLLQELQVLFVIDGYDEAGDDAKDLLHEILTSLLDSKVIITTKTQWVPKLIEKVKIVTCRYKVLSIAEITEEKRQQCVRKMFTAMEQESEDCDRFLSYLDEMKESVDSLIKLPLTFSLLVMLWIDEPGQAEKITTLTELYDKLIGLILKRVTKQLRMSDSFCCHEWMITLGKVAWDNLKRNKHYLSEEDQLPLKRKAKKLKLGVEGNNHIISSLLYCEIHSSLMDEKSWTFKHNSQQEYFAAKYIVHSLGNDKADSLSDILELSRETGEKYKKRLQRLVPVVELVYGLQSIHNRITEAGVRELTEIMSVREPWSFIALEKIFRYLLQKNPEMECVLKSMFTNEEMDTFEGYDPQSTLWVLKNTSLGVRKEVTVIDAVSNVPRMKPWLDYLLSKAHSIKVVVNIDKLSDISSLAQFTEQDGYKDIRFAFMAWKPLCIFEVVTKWPYSSPLYLSLHSDVFPLVWWETLTCLLTMKEKQVTKVVCSQADQKCLKLLKEGATWLSAEVVIDDSLAATDVVIHCKDCKG